MEASVRYITHSNDVGCKPSLCFRGTKWAHCVVNDDFAIHVIDIPLREFDSARPVEHHGVPYPITRAAERLLEFSRRQVARREITQHAKQLLEGVLDGTISAETIELPPDPVFAPPVKNDDDAPAKGGASPILAAICAELSIEPTVARRKLRKAGLHAPYSDEAKIRSVLTTK